MDIKIAVSILTCDFSILYEQIKEAEDAGVDLLHLDIMDGHFVPNITIGPAVARSLKKRIKLPFDVHLMIQNPLDFINEFGDVSDILTVHTETCENVPDILRKIKKLEIKTGIALNPNTDVSSITDYIKDLNMVTIMTVNPGFGGQSFMPSVLPKIEKMRNIILQKGLNIDIEVDGGINPQNALQVVEKGANILVAGASVFNNKSIKESIKELKDAINTKI